MKKPNLEGLRALFEQERALEIARRRAGQRSPRPDGRESRSGAPDTAVGSGGAGVRTTSAPEHGTAGPSGGKSIEVTARARPAVRKAPAAARTKIDESLLLDAYWASYGTATIRAMLRRMKTLESTTLVGTTDERTEVGNTEDYPWRCIASLLITDQNGGVWIGTGWLAAPRMLITAGHNVYMADQGGWASQIEVIPGRRGDLRPFNSCFASGFRSVTGWTQDRNSDFDYGAILLSPDCRYGDQLGWFGYGTRSDADFDNLLINLSGYPGDKPPGTQWFAKDVVTHVTDYKVTYKVDTAGGMSGAPVWVRNADGNRYGQAIHTYGDFSGTGNHGNRITANAHANFNDWRAEVP